MGYQWVSISWSISVKDFRYTYICLWDMLSRDSISNMTLYWFILWILGIGVHQYWPVLHKNSYIGITFLAVTCNLQIQRNQNYQYISNRPNISKVFNWWFDCARNLILAIGIVSPTTVQIKAKADALIFICCLWTMHACLEILVYVDYMHHLASKE